MPVFKRKGPLPDGHPLKGGLVIFGAKRPKPIEIEKTEEVSTNQQSETRPQSLQKNN